MSDHMQDHEADSTLRRLLADARAGDPDAFATLLAQYSPMMESKLRQKRRLIPALTPEDEWPPLRKALLAPPTVSGPQKAFLAEGSDGSEPRKTTR